MRRFSKQSRSSPSHILNTPPNSPPSSSSPTLRSLLHFPWVCKATVEQSMSKSKTDIPSNKLSFSSASFASSKALSCFSKSPIFTNTCGSTQSSRFFSKGFLFPQLLSSKIPTYFTNQLDFCLVNVLRFWLFLKRFNERRRKLRFLFVLSVGYGLMACLFTVLKNSFLFFFLTKLVFNNYFFKSVYKNNF